MRAAIIFSWPAFTKVGDIKPKSGYPVLMQPYMGTIYIKITGLPDTFKLNKYFLICGP